MRATLFWVIMLRISPVFLDFWALKMGPIGYPEMSKKLPFLVRNNTDDRSFYVLRGGSRKSCIIFLIQLHAFIIYETDNPKIYSNYHTLAEAFKNHTVPCYLWW